MIPNATYKCKKDTKKKWNFPFLKVKPSKRNFVKRKPLRDDNYSEAAVCTCSTK